MGKWIWSYIKKYSFLMASGLLLTVIVAALNMVNPTVAGQIVDRVIRGGEKSLLLTFVLIMISATVLKSLVRYGYQMIFEHVSQNVIRNIREDLYDHVQKQDFSWFDRSPPGNVMTLMTGDLDAVRHFIAWVLYQIFENIIVFVFSIIVLSSINWILTLAFMIIAPIIIFLVLRFKDKIKPSHTKVRDQFARLNTRVAENIAGNRVVKAFVRENYEMERFQKENMTYRDTTVDNANVRIAYLPVIESIGGALPVILILLGGYLIINGHLTIGELVTFNGLMWAFTQPINMMGNLVNDAQRFAASADRLWELKCRKSRIVNEPDAIAAGRVKGDVEFKNVSFKYNEVTVLENISFKAESGQTIGILGPTGSGKSTIAKLLCRYYDCTEGSVLIDGIDVKKYTLESLRRNAGITMQDVFLFSDTIEGNIAFGKPDATMEEVKKAADLAFASAFIKDLSAGYDTIVGERGVGLSGGQRQRIALARLFLMDTPIMILDDTTSSVDVETEEQIRDSIAMETSGHTTFIIAHRISSLEKADLILVVENGKITDRGTHKELLARPGYYRHVWLHQNGYEGDIQTKVIGE